MKALFSIYFIAILGFFPNFALSQNTECNGPEVKIYVNQHIDLPETENLASEMKKVSRTVCLADIDTYTRAATKLSVRMVSNTSYCGTAMSNSELVLLIGQGFVWSAADLTRCLVNIVESVGFVAGGGDDSNICSLAQLASDEVASYSDIYEKFEVAYPEDETNLRIFANHVLQMQTNKLNLEASCNFSKDDLPPIGESSIEI